MLFEHLKIGFCLRSVFIKYRSRALYVCARLCAGVRRIEVSVPSLECVPGSQKARVAWWPRAEIWSQAACVAGSQPRHPVAE